MSPDPYRPVNSAQGVANWLIGREIVEEEQQGSRRAGYGDPLIRDLARQLGRKFGGGYGLSQLKDFRAFYLTYDNLPGGPKGHAVRGLSIDTAKSYALRSLFGPATSDAPPRKSNALRSKSGEWEPGWLNPNLSWTRQLLNAFAPTRVSTPAATAFDLVRYAPRIGGIGRAAETLRPLLSQIRGPELKEVLEAENETTSAQRLGFILEKSDHPKLADLVAEWLSGRRQPVNPASPPTMSWLLEITRSC